MYLLVQDAVFQLEHWGFLNCSKTKSISKNKAMKSISDRKCQSYKNQHFKFI